MENLQEAIDFFKNGHINYRPHLTVDCAIFGYIDGQLQILLSKHKFFTMWCLPGFYVRKDENLDQAAARITAERTGLKDLFLRQFKTFGNLGRHLSPAFAQEKLTGLTGITLDETNWLQGSTVSVGYYALTDIVKVKPTIDFLSSECRWFAIDQLPPLGFDHDEMVQEALATMRMHLYHFPLSKRLLPPKFTLKEIKQFYEVMSGKTLNASNFPNKLISLELIEKTNDQKKNVAHRSPTYYRFNEQAYQEALIQGKVLV
ncbi:NUDIX hydrolase [Pontibacter qinzhouensis]|uniref:NUDIX hydrolase n=1 Tax=Pontibacter qinzhouensis TaxID=2603253 RepID=A0A5C8IGP6_9BACT|nr:NUDIX domain-containing protein [Pontibacter qinzhouensis]TXK21003.1 NUDIX hydrolase [Pontibacter qinzhouensis]